MLDINKLKTTWYFKEITLEKWEVLFDEWDIDSNIYLIILWELQIEKYISNNRDDTKVLAYLKNNDIFWESALNTNKEKEVKITARKKTNLLYINAQEDFNKFSIKYPYESSSLLKYIIFLTNKRLLESNHLIAATYKITKEITKIEKITNKKIFELIDSLRDIIGVDYIIYLEKNLNIENYLTLKYDTRNKWKMSDKIIEITDSKLFLLNLKIWNYYSYNQKIAIWNEELGILFFIKKNNDFTDNDKKAILLTITSIAGVMKQKRVHDEERDKNYMQN